MNRNPFAPDFADLPEKLPIFPLSGVLLLPTGNLPLNIFEPRYLRMIEDAMKTNRLIGMIQPKSADMIYETGCAGKITEFTETMDGRYLVTLTGICRFKVARELDAATPYRQVQCDWSPFEKDLENVGSLKLDRKKLNALLKSYFIDHELQCDWEKIETATDGRLITCLSMICPFDAKEKQALLEAESCKVRAETFMAMLEMAVRAGRAPQMCKSEH